MRLHSRGRRGFSLVELLIVVAVISVLYFKLAPAISEIKARSVLRASRQELISVFSAARSTALQKGRNATLTLTSTSTSVTVLSSVNGSAITLAGPVSFLSTFGTSLTALSSAPTTVTFDARGLITPASAAITRYVLSTAGLADTVCVSGAGIVLIHGCQL